MLILVLCGCARYPLVQISPDKFPHFADDSDHASLKTAIKTNIEYLRTLSPHKTVSLAGNAYSISHLIFSQEYFLELLADNPSSITLNRQIKEYFDVYQAIGTRGINLGRKMLVTGYYQPVFEGSLNKQEPFIYPLYSVPPDLVQRNDSGAKLKIGRKEGNRLVPYWTRKEIETLGKTAGSEIVWLRDPFDAFVLHVQGSGLIRLRDNSIRGIHFAARNGHNYKSIGRYMVETGRMKLENASMQTIRDYLTKNPEEIETILHKNPSYIFFKWTDTHGALGNVGKELTPGRSIAADQKCFPPGLLGFLFSRAPGTPEPSSDNSQFIKRFVVVQDTGSAIKGPGRVDLFWGAGTEAGLQAGRMKDPGTLYFFVLKQNAPVMHNTKI